MTHKLKCQTITVRFNKPHMKGQEISFRHGQTACHYLAVEHDAVRLAIHFMDGHERVLRSLCFSSLDVNEYDCKGVVDAGPNKDKL